MRIAGLVILVVVIALGQVSLLPAIRPFGVVPNAFLALVVVLGLRSTISSALITAIIGGIIMDLASGSSFGSHTGILVVAVLATGMVRRAGISLDGWLIGVGIVIIATILSALVLLLPVVSFSGDVNVGGIIKILFFELMLNSIITLIMRPIVHWVSPDEATLPTID